MTKRITLPPLGEHDDDWLRILAWLNNSSKSAQAAALISIGITERKAQVQEMLDYIARKRSITPDELIKNILAGTAKNEPDGLDEEE